MSITNSCIDIFGLSVILRADNVTRDTTRADYPEERPAIPGTYAPLHLRFESPPDQNGVHDHAQYCRDCTR